MAAWLVPVALIARSRVIAAGDTLTSRGPFRTRAWRRDEIDGFAITQSGWSHRVSRIEVHTPAGARVPSPSLLRPDHCGLRGSNAGFRH
jgi:hypothetical protein